MPEIKDWSGSCLCGQCRWSASGDPDFSGYCFCAHCRRMSGSGRTPFIGFPLDRVQVFGETKNYMDTSDSGGGIQRHFCPDCGTR